MPDRDLHEERMDCYQFGTVPTPDKVSSVSEELGRAVDKLLEAADDVQRKAIATINELEALRSSAPRTAQD